MEPETFTVRLRRLRDERKLTNQQLADLAGVPLRALHELTSERGKNEGRQHRRRPTYGMVVRLCRALDVPLETFADCEDILDEPAPAKGRGRAGGKAAKRT